MSYLPDGFGFSGKQFWSTQLTVPGQKYSLEMESSTELHISKAIIQSQTVLPKKDGNINIFVQYDDDCQHLRDDVYDYYNNVCPDPESHVQCCLVGILNPQNKPEADLDIKFRSRLTKNGFLYFEFEDSECKDKVIVNLSGYVVGSQW